MSQRKLLKKEIAKQKAFLSDLPRLVDCSKAYGDEYYTSEDIERTKRRIRHLELQLDNLIKPLL